MRAESEVSVNGNTKWIVTMVITLILIPFLGWLGYRTIDLGQEAKVACVRVDTIEKRQEKILDKLDKIEDHTAEAAVEIKTLSRLIRSRNNNHGGN